MKVAIIDADLIGRWRHRFPNLACEKISGYWKAKGAEVELKLDYDNRPRQMVAPDGKQAITHFKVIATQTHRTRVRFYPITGRTHQLRVHSAHKQGLGIPIVGDDLYGVADERLFLHAEELEFTHPTSGERIKLNCRAEF